eukprot:304235-Pelagomonas_calceolata.AAC.1
MLVENVSPAADRPESRAVGQTLVTPPYINLGKGNTLAQRRRMSPQPQSHRKKGVNGDMEGYWKHLAPAL